MFRPLFEQGENRQARFAEPEKSAATRSTGKLRERPPIFPGPRTAVLFTRASHEISDFTTEIVHKIAERLGEAPFGISHSPFGDMEPTGMQGVREMGAPRIVIPIGSHIYIVRYLSDDIVLQ